MSKGVIALDLLRGKSWRGAGSGDPARRRRAHATAVGVRFDRRVGSFVRKCSPELGSQLNAERKNTLAAANAVPGF